MSENPRGQRLYAATPHLMYARKASLAIDGKAMYFGGRCQASDRGLRPSDADPQPRISQIHADKATEKDF